MSLKSWNLLKKESDYHYYVWETTSVEMKKQETTNKKKQIPIHTKVKAAPADFSLPLVRLRS